jgi:hypothetical protein
MHKLAGLCVLLLLVLPAAAQEAPKAELFGGYSYASFEGGNGVDRLNLNGWNTSVAGNFNRWFGVVGDFSGQYGSQAGVDRNTHSFLFGPRFFSRNNERMTPFVHALFGIARAHREGGSGEPARTENAFSTAIGGGLDVKAGEAVAIRLVQADYFLTRFDEASGIVCIQSNILPCPSTRTGTQHNFRFSTGVVFRFGGR